MMTIGAPHQALAYRADLKSTATIVTYALMDEEFEKIYLTYDCDDVDRNYCLILNEWLRKRNRPIVLIDQAVLPRIWERIIPPPYWGWTEAECRAAILLAGLPLPPRAGI